MKRAPWLAFIGLLFLAFGPWASANVYYSSRPDVLQVDPKDHKSVRGVQDPARVANAYLYLLAEIMTFFPNGEYYFLARDIENLYDTARALYKNDAKMKRRFHLVPISTKLSGDVGIADYLHNEGLNHENLGHRPAVFIDSCCAGSVPTNIENRFVGSGLRIQGFLIENETFPESELFMKMADESGESIEDHPHFTGSGAELERMTNGKFEVRMQPDDSDPASALRMMQLIREKVDKSSTRRTFADALEQMGTVYSYALKRRGTTFQSAALALLKLRDKHGVPAEDFLNDIESMSRKSYAKVHAQRLNSLADEIRDKKLTARGIKTVGVPLIYEDFDEYEDEDKAYLAERALARLANETFAQLGNSLKEAVPRKSGDSAYSHVVHWWLSNLDLDLIDNNPKIIDSLLVSAHRAKSAAELLNSLSLALPADYYRNPLSRKVTQSISSGLIRACARSGFSLEKGSLFAEILKHGIVDHPDLPNSILRAAIKEAGPEQMDTLMITILKNHDLLQNPHLFSWLKRAIKDRGKVTKEVASALLNNEELRWTYEYEEFFRWLLIRHANLLSQPALNVLEKRKSTHGKDRCEQALAA